jgi:hypothetical protein
MQKNMLLKKVVAVVVAFIFAIPNIPRVVMYARADITPPSVTINFAGNMSDKGGPYYRPPEEGPGSPNCEDGYYTNDSKQQEDWIYINCTIIDVSLDYDELWVNWLNGTTWTNWTYNLVRTTNNYFEFNSNGNVSNIGCGYIYSFNIVANDTSDNTRTVAWYKKGINNSDIRRFVQMNCTPINVNYTPYYCHDACFVKLIDTMKPDRLHHDQGADGSTATGYVDTGYMLKEIPTDSKHITSCASEVGYFFDESVCTQNFTLENIYLHFWWNCNNIIKPCWSKTKQCMGYGTDFDEYETSIAKSCSCANTYVKILNDSYFERKYYLEANLLNISDNNRI